MGFYRPRLQRSKMNLNIELSRPAEMEQTTNCSAALRSCAHPASKGSTSTICYGDPDSPSSLFGESSSSLVLAAMAMTPRTRALSSVGCSYSSSRASKVALPELYEH